MSRTSTEALIAALTPTVHLNGSSGEMLTRALHDAVEALAVAERCFADAAPNARDYYVRGSGAYEAAYAAHRALGQRLEQVRTVLAEVYLGVEDQLTARRHASDEPEA